MDDTFSFKIYAHVPKARRGSQREHVLFTGRHFGNLEFYHAVTAGRLRRQYRWLRRMRDVPADDARLVIHDSLYTVSLAHAADPVIYTWDGKA